MLPKTLGKGSAPCASPNLLEGLPSAPLWMGADYRSPCGPFSGGRAPSGDLRNSVALVSTFVCLGGISHTFAQALLALMSLGSSSCPRLPPVQTATRGIGPGPGPGLFSAAS